MEIHTLSAIIISVFLSSYSGKHVEKKPFDLKQVSHVKTKLKSLTPGQVTVQRTNFFVDIKSSFPEEHVAEEHAAEGHVPEEHVANEFCMYCVRPYSNMMVSEN